MKLNRNGLRRKRIEQGQRVNYLLDGLSVICEFSDSGDILGSMCRKFQLVLVE